MAMPLRTRIECPECEADLSVKLRGADHRTCGACATPRTKNRADCGDCRDRAGAGVVPGDQRRKPARGNRRLHDSGRGNVLSRAAHVLLIESNLPACMKSE